MVHTSELLQTIDLSTACSTWTNDNEFSQNIHKNPLTILPMEKPMSVSCKYFTMPVNRYIFLAPNSLVVRVQIGAIGSEIHDEVGDNIIADSCVRHHAGGRREHVHGDGLHEQPAQLAHGVR